ncbi:hypothetical protein [Salininema proteolyticum]|uniref:Uncharacterized protein n=1 Tax=Salininema proteolyticum TaxID=1607685 RepID=A0ABV8TXJ4_9ACTN
MSLDHLSLHMKRDIDLELYEWDASAGSRPEAPTTRLVHRAVGSFGKLRMRSLWKEHDEHR